MVGWHLQGEEEEEEEEVELVQVLVSDLHSRSSRYNSKRQLNR